MKRRSTLKKLVAGAFAPMVMFKEASADEKNLKLFRSEKQRKPEYDKAFQSRWHLFEDMTWLGEEHWAQRLQDWCIENGELKCLCREPNRTVHLLTHQVTDKRESFQSEVTLRFPKTLPNRQKGDFAGFKIGVKGKFDDYRSACITGQGLNIGVNTDGSMFIGQQFAKELIPEEILSEGIRLTLKVEPADGDYSIALVAEDKRNDTKLSSLEVRHIPGSSIAGNIGLVSHFNDTKSLVEPAAYFSDWQLSGGKIAFYPGQEFGAIYFAQYSLNNNILKLSAQLAPVDLPSGKAAILEIKKGSQWEKAADAVIHPQARVASFRVENWDGSQKTPYRVVYEMPLKSRESIIYTYEGSIAAEPIDKEKINALVFSCNWDQGFPDTEVVENASKHQADVIFFVGDQFYEANGGFGIETGKLDRSVLDYLRKWYQFGWLLSRIVSAHSFRLPARRSRYVSRKFVGMPWKGH